MSEQKQKQSLVDGRPRTPARRETAALGSSLARRKPSGGVKFSVGPGDSGHRGSHARSSHSSRASKALGGGGPHTAELKVVDTEDGQDRTPKTFTCYTPVPPTVKTGSLPQGFLFTPPSDQPSHSHLSPANSLASDISTRSLSLLGKEPINRQQLKSAAAGTAADNPRPSRLATEKSREAEADAQDLQRRVQEQRPSGRSRTSQLQRPLQHASGSQAYTVPASADLSSKPGLAGRSPSDPMWVGNKVASGELALQKLAALPAALWQLEAEVLRGSRQQALLLYRGAEAPAASGQNGPEMLWEWAWEGSAGVVATCMALLTDGAVAIGYGARSIAERPRKGALCVFRPENTRSPHRFVRTRCGVSALACSSSGLLAVGLQDGSLQLWDSIAEVLEQPVAEASGQGAIGPIWDLRWLEQEAHKPLLLAAAADGRLCQWNCSSEDLEATALLQMQSGALGGPAAVLTVGLLGAAGWLAGGEDGCLHEAGGRRTRVHLGPVYRVEQSPFVLGLLLTASEDGSAKLWSHGEAAALLSLEGGGGAVTDAAWSPFHSTQLATGTRGGQVQLWDLEASVATPVASVSLPDGSSVARLAFLPAAPVLLACGGDGCSVFLLPSSWWAAQPGPGSPREARARLLGCLAGARGRPV